MGHLTRQGILHLLVHREGRRIAGYRRVRRLVAPTFGRLDGVAAQTEAYAERFRALGVAAPRVSVADSLKWDVELPTEMAAVLAEIAAEVYLSDKTVKNYVSSILSKLNLQRRAQAAAYVAKHKPGSSF